jgi:hypothetical protein
MKFDAYIPSDPLKPFVYKLIVSESTEKCFLTQDL